MSRAPLASPEALLTTHPQLAYFCNKLNSSFTKKCWLSLYFLLSLAIHKLNEMTFQRVLDNVLITEILECIVALHRLRD